MARHGFSSKKFLLLFDERSGSCSRPLLSKNHNVFVLPPPLLPGEILMLQQDNVTCVNTLAHPATGCLHLTNFRIIFAGKFMIRGEELQNVAREQLEKFGYRYQEQHNLRHKIKNFVPYTTFKQKRKKPSTKNIVFTTSLDDFSLTSNSASNITDDQKKSHDIVLSIPLLCILEMKKFPKQYLEEEKLLMLNPGIEIISTYYLSCKFCLGDDCSYDSEELLKLLLKHSKIKNPNGMFAFTYRESLVLPKSYNILDDESLPNFYKMSSEISRLDLLASSDWKMTEQHVCATYPMFVVTHRSALSKSTLKTWSDFHKGSCFPILCWKNVATGNVLLRSGGAFSARGCSDVRNIVDEEIMNGISSALSADLLKYGNVIIFTDSYSSLSQASSNNTLKKGESLASLQHTTSFFYPRCKTIYLDNLPPVCNSHSSALKLLQLLNRSSSEDVHYLSSLEECGWMNEISILLEYSLCVLNSLEKLNTGVIVSLGNGTERAAQLTSLVELMCDPYYRTFNGFQVLIQKEWLSVKHPFYKRNFLPFSKDEDLSPMFLQFLDCVYQISIQFPTAFQFSNDFLEFLTLHAYAGRFDTFTDIKFGRDGVSIWSYINVYTMVKDNFLNFNYDEKSNNGVLKPSSSQIHLEVWPWFNRNRRDESLFISQMFAVMETEKLQVEFKDLLKLHSKLLHRLSKHDERSNERSFNSQSVTSSDTASLYSDSSCRSSFSLDSPFDDEQLDWKTVDDIKYGSLDSTASSNTLISPTEFTQAEKLNMARRKRKFLKKDYPVTNVTMDTDVVNSSNIYEMQYQSFLEDEGWVPVKMSEIESEMALADQSSSTKTDQSSSSTKTCEKEVQRSMFYVGHSFDSETYSISDEENASSKTAQNTVLLSPQTENINNGDQIDGQLQMEIDDTSNFLDKINGDTSDLPNKSEDDNFALQNKLTKMSLNIQNESEGDTSNLPISNDTSDLHERHIEFSNQMTESNTDISTNQKNKNPLANPSFATNNEIPFHPNFIANGSSKKNKIALQVLKGFQTSIITQSKYLTPSNFDNYLAEKASSNEFIASNTSFRGFLIKQGNRYKSWKRRWFILDLLKKEISYFERKESIAAKGIFRYDSIHSVFPDKNQKKNRFMFHVETKSRTYPIVATEEDLMIIWIHCFSIDLKVT